MNVSTEAQLQTAVGKLASNTTIVLAPGTYRLSDALWINGTFTNVGIRGATNNRDDVVLKGAGMTNGSVEYGIWAGGNVNGILIANLTIRDIYYHAINFNAGTQSPRVYNVHLIDAGEQFIKSNPDGAGGGVNNGIVEYSVMEYTTTAPTYYTGGVDVHTGANWIIRDNLFRNIVSPPGAELAVPTVLMWNHSSNTLTERNLFLNCARGISYGLDVKGFDHSGGIIRNNFIFRSASQPGDVGILVADSPNTEVLNNTIFLSGTYGTPIEYRFSGTQNVVIANNLLDGTIWARDGAKGTLTSNLVSAAASLFVSATTGDLHLVSSATSVINRGSALSAVTDDWDGDTRPSGAAYDIGADEYGAASPTTYSIVGAVVDGSGAAVASVSMALSGSGVQSTTTNSTGQYTFAGLPAGGSYTVTPSKSGYSFQPASQSFGSLSANQTATNFRADPAAPPSIATQPVNQAVTAGQNAQFTVAAAGVVATYQWQVATSGGSTWTDLTNTSPYSGVSTATLVVTSVTPSLNGTRYRAIVSDSAGAATSSAAALTVRGAMSASRSTLRFVATKAGAAGVLLAVTPAQTVTVTFAGAASAWTAAFDQPWLVLTGGSASTAGQFTAAVVNPGNVIGGSTLLTATITVTAATAPNPSLTIPLTLTVDQSGTGTAAPFGAFDTPANGATVQGAIPVTGWSLDDVGVDRVELWRNCVETIDRAAGACAAAAPGGAADFVFIGRGAFLAGARPDVEASFATSPMAYRAGWGYLMLTNALPHLTTLRREGGQGTFTLSAYAVDVENHYTRLGTKTITLDNDHATIPFGAIDTPDQGGTVPGSTAGYNDANAYPNFGWAMTQAGKCIDTSSTGSYRVYIDGVVRPLTPGTNWFPGLNRSDIAAAFPGYCNTTNALAAYYINADALGLANGLHTIGWDVIDNQGKVAGIGSRFFIVSR